jgi:YihY family inner membrane protein
MNEIWDVPHDDRPNAVVVRIRALAMLGVLGAGLVGAVLANNLTHLPLGIAGETRLFIYAGNLVLDVCIVGLAYQVLTDRSLARHEILPGAVVAGLGYFSVQLLGSWFVQRAVNGATETYGTFAVVIGLLAWFHLLAQITLLGAEINVVASRRLWPRSLTGRHLTDADIRTFRRYVEAVRRLEQAGPGVHPGRKPA